jgi:hypothetical protein
MDYERVTKRNSYTVNYNSLSKTQIGFGQVHLLAVHNTCMKNLAFIISFEMVGNFENLNNEENNTLEIIQKCENSIRFDVIEIENLFSLCAIAVYIM